MPADNSDQTGVKLKEREPILHLIGTFNTSVLNAFFQENHLADSCTNLELEALNVRTLFKGFATRNEDRETCPESPIQKGKNTEVNTERKKAI